RNKMTQIKPWTANDWFNVMFKLQIQGNLLDSEDDFANWALTPMYCFLGGRKVEVLKLDEEYAYISGTIKRVENRNYIEIALMIIFVVPGVIFGVYYKYRQISKFDDVAAAKLISHATDQFPFGNLLNDKIKRCVEKFSFPSEHSTIHKDDISLFLEMPSLFPRVGYLNLGDEKHIFNETEKKLLFERNIIVEYNGCLHTPEEYFSLLEAQTNV
ncbi:MAG: hypothetical protein P0S94_04210, partial [Simkaniaceae bacterium]|nr:hypothetical protein [Simkaniaceae bacterium]